MGEIEEFVMETIVSRRETIKPSSPTPPHLKTFQLSYLNQILPLIPIFPTCGLVFYNASPETQKLDLTHLKTCLSKTLSKFYPLAGKVNNSTVNCNDEGIEFIEAKANCSISSLLNSPRKLEVMAKFLPPTECLGMIEQQQPISELTHIAIQVTLFTCGGVSIGWYDIHKVLDGISAAIFFKYWAALASQRPKSEMIHPDLDACVAAFPPTTKSLQLPVVNVYKEEAERSPTVAKSFIFRPSAITQLKERAVSDEVPNPTSFQAIAGFLWEQAMNASKTVETNTGSVLHVTLDIRSRVNPPLPNGSIGNLAVITVARAEKETKMPQLVSQIISAVSEMKEEIKEYQGEEGVEALIKNWSKVINTLVEYKDRAYRLISWSRLGFADLDFGFGKPTKMVPTDGRMSPFHRNMIILNDYRDEQGDGIEAWLFLEHNDMITLESTPQFLAFASPHTFADTTS